MSRGAEIFRIALLGFSAVATGMAAAERRAPAPGDGRVIAAIVEQPRPFGYVIGDLVTQRVLLTTPRQAFEPGELPRPQRVNIWLERRASRIEETSDGRRWLAVEYQLINAPPALTEVRVPAWRVASKNGDAQLAVPAATISIAPLISDSTSAAGELRPDREVAVIDTATSRASVWLWSIALFITLLAWLGWWRWRNWRDSHDRPFARAMAQLRRIDETTPEAWQAVHRAFDQTAGRVLQIETLPALFERAPHLQSRRAEIERFFAQSNERFFGAGPPGNLVSVRALCQELRRIERRHAQ